MQVDPTLMAFAEYISLADTFFKPIIYVKFGSRVRQLSTWNTVPWIHVQQTYEKQRQSHK